jgi:mRNA interferase RelE/StbE
VTYSVLILRRAQRELAGLASDVYVRIRDAIQALAQDPRPQGHLKLTGRNGFRLRIGDYRVIYEIDDEQRVVTILHIGHRRDVYK